jgi:hypothetical protein
LDQAACAHINRHLAHGQQVAKLRGESSVHDQAIFRGDHAEQKMACNEFI